MLLDEWNFRRFRESPMRRNGNRFWSVMVPISVLYWLYFEFVNLAFRQWAYAGAPENAMIGAILAFLSFGTVIPIVIEIIWIFWGSLHLADFARFLPPENWHTAVAAVGLLMLVFPLVNESFWPNQIMWLAPGMFFLPLLGDREVLMHVARRRASFPLVIMAFAWAGAVSGLIWEFLNFWSGARWQYLVFPEMPHLFAMPILGYLGFIPFAWSTIVVYLWAERIRSRLGAIALIAVAFLASLLFAAHIPRA